LRQTGRMPRLDGSRRAHNRVRRAACSVVAVLTAASTLIPPAAHANVWNVYGAGSRNIAMGGATVASTTDWSSGQTNPAGIAFAETSQLTIGAFWAKPRLKVQFETGPPRLIPAFPNRSREIEDHFGPQFGVVARGEDLFQREFDFPWAIGAGVHLPNAALFVQRSIRNEELFSVIFQERALAVGFNLWTAVRLLPYLSLGAGMTFNLSLLLSSDVVVDQNGQQFLSTDSDTRPSVTFIGGIQYRPTETLSFGASYIGRQRWSTRGTALTVAPALSFGDPRIPPAGTVLAPPPIFTELRMLTSYTPKQVQFGAAWQVTERLQLDAALHWQEWSDYRTTQGTRLFNEFDDTWIPRIGLEYRVTRDFAVRAGFSYEPTPVTEQPPGFNLLGADRYIPAIGLEYRFEDPFGYLAKPIKLELAGFYHHLKERDFDETTPAPPLDTLDPGELVGLLLIPDFAAQIDVDEPHTLDGYVFGVSGHLTFQW